MIATMTTEVKNFTAPDEVRRFSSGRLELVHIGDHIIGKFILQPGWRWSKDVKPIAKTEWCEAPHFQYIVSGHLHLRTSEGQEYDFRAGDVAYIAPGHDGWVVGNETCVGVDWAGVGDYAQR